MRGCGWLTLLGLVLVGGACGGRSHLLTSAPHGDGASPPLNRDGGPQPDEGIPRDLALSPDARADAPRPTQEHPAVPGRWVTVPAATFYMGSPSDEPCRLPNETRHRVTLTRSFRISTTEVTQADLARVLERSLSQLPACADCPADSVSWSAALAYCNTLSRLANVERCYRCDADGVEYAFPYECQEGEDYSAGGKSIQQCKGYRLPTEAEWEMAYRAGSQTALQGRQLTDCQRDAEAGAVAWYHYNAAARTSPVARLRPNAFGLYDMAGNVWEWVHDVYTSELGTGDVTDPTGPAAGATRVLRGGSWSVSAAGVRAASRNHLDPQASFTIVGFRCVRTVGN